MNPAVLHMLQQRLVLALQQQDRRAAREARQAIVAALWRVSTGQRAPKKTRLGCSDAVVAVCPKMPS